MSFNDLGYELIEHFIDSKVLAAIIEETDTALLSSHGGGIRNADKKFISICSLATSKPVIDQVASFLTGQPCLVRAILFDKTPQNNWLVTWHQDKTIAVSSKFNADGWGPWSLKDGIHHVQPPLDVLTEMVTLRIHLDASTAENGCLRLIPKSHSHGILKQKHINQYAKAIETVQLEAPACSALVMRPHILHASSKALAPTRRRVLHLEYSSYNLPTGVYWA